MSRIGVLALLAAALLAGCSGSEPRVPWETDGAPSTRLDPAQVQDAVPRPDPILDAGNTSPYTVNGMEYRVLTTAAGYREEGIASWYGTKFHGNKTANGEVYDVYLPSAAHRSLPIPSYVRVTNLQNGRAVTVRVNDRGPFHPDRIIDLSYAAAVKLGMVQHGTARVRVEAIDVAGVDDRRGLQAGDYRYLQLGAFASPDSALDLRNAVAALVSVPVTVTPVDVNGRRLNRVRVGPVRDGRELLRLQEMLMSKGYSSGLALP
jgi:rare lipoprotein A